MQLKGSAISEGGKRVEERRNEGKEREREKSETTSYSEVVNKAMESNLLYWKLLKETVSFANN